jgi:hypothetical protein
MLPLVFALGSAYSALTVILDPGIIGSHAAIYTGAARAWLEMRDPWEVGPIAAKFAGPPTMLLPFAPFVVLPVDVTRLIWVCGSAALSIWSLRRLGLPGYWLGFPPLFGAIVLGHPEVVVLSLLVMGGAGAGLACLIKPYAGFPLVAERAWRALAVAGGLFIVTAPLLPWGLFIQDLPNIAATLARQSHGDSVFGQPLPMLIAGAVLASLGLRRALWLATPLLWPLAQPGYKIMTIPQVSPLLALFWAIPLPGATLLGVFAEAVALRVASLRPVPAWLSSGIRPACDGAPDGMHTGARPSAVGLVDRT